MIKDFNLRLSPCDAYSEATIIQWLQKETGEKPTAIRILKRAIDARGHRVLIQLSIKAYYNEMPNEQTFTPIIYPDVSQAKQVGLVVGAGPGGLFAALRLIELGIKPIIVERGKDVRSRKADLARIRTAQQIDPESNYAFGEGGAGAYSDGKLHTRSKKRGNGEKILQVLVQHGASPSILVDAHPHIGTDCLPRVIENIRHTILQSGGEVHFQTRMDSLMVRNNEVIGIRCTHLPSGESREWPGPVIMATGHSARDVYRMLFNQGIEIETKGIAIGVRLEHPAKLIDQIQYHSNEGRGKWLPAAEYSMVEQVNGRGVYSFCMCPGGVIVPAASGPEQIVVNGMSPSHRGGQWSNSGMVVEVRTEDLANLCSTHKQNALAMMHFQEQIERVCWQQGHYTQTAPAQRMADFVNNRFSTLLPHSSYAPGIESSPLHEWLPNGIASRLRTAFQIWGKRMRGFLTNEAIILGVETRTSSPVRIVRNPENLQHIRLAHLYPCGEGAGYAGGIVSAAVDGERCAEALAGRNQVVQ